MDGASVSPPRSTSRVVPLVAIAAGAALSIALGVYGREHTPTFEPITTLGFGSMIEMKVWLAIAVAVLAVAQLVGALWMYGKLGIAAPGWLGIAHRASGVLLVVVSLPVAYHCLWSLGFQSYDTRVLVHSLAGCIVYGAVVTKVVAVQSSSAPGWLIPLAGGLLFTVFVVVVLTSAGWYLNEFGLPSG
jgi:Family of unknown function (DUF6529)